jgi:hypothetical protein
LWARAILIELVREMNGYNNGEIGLSQRQMGERIGTSNYRRIGPAIAELMEHGLIDVSAEGVWKQRLAREYRLTFVSTGKPGHYKPATNEYRAWKPKEKSCVAAVSAGAPKPADPVATERSCAAATVAADLNGKLPKTLTGSAETVASLINKPYPLPRKLNPSDEPRKMKPGLGGSKLPDRPTATFGGRAAEEAVRDKIIAHWTQLDSQARAAWATGHGLTFEELRDFVIGCGHLPFPKQVALRSAAARCPR